MEADIVEEAVKMVLDATEFGGFGLRTADLGGYAKCRSIGEKVCEVVREKLAAISAQEYWPAQISGAPATEEMSRDSGMTLCEKILAHHAIGLKTPVVRPGQMVCVKVDWTL